MKKRRILIITACVVVIGIVLGVALTRGAGPIGTLTTVNVTRGDIVKTVLVDGNLEMPNKAYLSFGVAGTVTEVLVDEGTNVTEDQVLARLDAPSLESAVQMAELQVKIAKEQVKSARAQYEIALINLDEGGGLLGESEEVLELRAAMAKAGWETAKLNLETVELNLDEGGGLLGESEEVLELRVDMAKAGWETAKLNLETVELNLESAELNLEKAQIVAPFDGLVTDVAITEGKEITAAMLASPSITVINASRIELRGFIDEIDVSMVRTGQAAIVVFDALPDEEVSGEVVFVSLVSTVRAGVISYASTISLEDPVAGLRDGMSATAEVVIERRDDVLMMPNRAIRGTLGNPKVMVMVDGQQEEREITLGLTDGINTEVLSGLEEGEEVVLPTAQERQNGFFMR